MATPTPPVPASSNPPHEGSAAPMDSTFSEASLPATGSASAEFSPKADDSRRGALNRNVLAVSATSFLTDVSSDMVASLIPLFLSNVLGVRTSVIGIIEGIAEATASILKVFSGWISDRLGNRKWLAVAGYAISTCSKPFYAVATSWGIVAGVRWADRVGKGIRTAPRDALVADSVSSKQRGFAFGFQRASDTAGALLGLVIALLIVWQVQAAGQALSWSTFRTVALVSLLPAGLAVLVLALGARDVPVTAKRAAPMLRLRGWGRPFGTFLAIVTIFELGNSSDAFLVLRAQEAGVSVTGILAVLILFNGIYALFSTPAGALSDRIGRKKVILAGWTLYALTYLGFAFASEVWHIWVLYALYALYYATTFGTAKALVADLVPAERRGAAYGTYNALLGIVDFPASLAAGVLWQGIGSWTGFGPAAPFLFGAGAAALATLLYWRWSAEGIDSPHASP